MTQLQTYFVLFKSLIIYLIIHHMDKYKMKMTARFSIINKTLSQIRKKKFFPALASFFLKPSTR